MLGNWATGRASAETMPDDHHQNRRRPSRRSRRLMKNLDMLLSAHFGRRRAGRVGLRIDQALLRATLEVPSVTTRSPGLRPARVK